jgi:hypothetical protein
MHGFNGNKPCKDQLKFIGKNRNARSRCHRELSKRANPEIPSGLRQSLADAFTGYLKTKNFRWHMTRPHFRDNRLPLDEQAGGKNAHPALSGSRSALFRAHTVLQIVVEMSADVAQWSVVFLQPCDQQRTFQ